MEKLTLNWLLKNNIIDIDRISGIRDASNACDYDFYGDTVEKWHPEIGKYRRIKMKSNELLKLNDNETIIRIETDSDGGILLILNNVNEVEE